MVRLPKLPDPDDALSLIDRASGAIDKGLGFIDKISSKLDKLGFTEEKSTEPIATIEKSLEGPAKGTACLPCCRDHLSTTSSSLSEGMRFVRDKGVRDPEVLRRIRIALDELNAMERIDLAPSQTAILKGAERELADWTLRQSRNLRHAITAIKDTETMEQAAAQASVFTEEFMSKLWSIPEKECETCGEIRERISEFIERRKRERGEE